MANILAVGDFHSGSNGGLTPPKYWALTEQPDAAEEAWQFTIDAISKMGKLSHLLLLGDLIDGAAYKDKACGLATADLDLQMKIATECLREMLKYARRDCKIFGVTGTGYHVDIHGTSAERKIAKAMGWDGVDDRMVVKIDGWQVDLRHKFSKTQGLHTGANSLQKDMNNNLNKETINTYGHIHCILRGHAHEGAHYWHPNMGHGFSLPALQLPGGKYGKQQCDGWVHYGVTNIKTKGDQLTEWCMPTLLMPPNGIKVYNG